MARDTILKITKADLDADNSYVGAAALLNRIIIVAPNHSFPNLAQFARMAVSPAADQPGQRERSFEHYNATNPTSTQAGGTSHSFATGRLWDDIPAITSAPGFDGRARGVEK